MSKPQAGMLSTIVGLYNEAPWLVSISVLLLVSTPIILAFIKSSDKRYIADVHDRKHLREMQHKRDELRAKIIAGQTRQREQAAQRRSER